MINSRKRMIVTGREGQVVRSLIERGNSNIEFEVIALGRPELNLLSCDGLASLIEKARPDILVSAAAYTAVDQAETDEDTAVIVNGIAAGKLAESAAELGVPIIHISTDYVFDGTKTSPYLELDPVMPIGSYGRSKLLGEEAVRSANSDHVILRTAWVYSPFGENFVKTMLRLAESRDTVAVVGDQVGNPTSALDIADAILTIAANLFSSDDRRLRGTYHLTGTGDTSWAEFANEVFRQAAMHGGPTASVRSIPSSDYPTPAKRPSNSRLDCNKLAEIHGVRLPDWKASLAGTIERLAIGQDKR
jgi:dTDP-4-dehydrorhamnose reductase